MCTAGSHKSDLGTRLPDRPRGSLPPVKAPPGHSLFCTRGNHPTANVLTEIPHHIVIYLWLKLFR